jgi:hypothetical protein
LLPNNNRRVVAATAISPVAGPNALYLWRPDIAINSKGEPRPEGITWRVALAQDKKPARVAGALDLKWRTEKDTDLIPVMSKKVLHLIGCEPEEFYSRRYGVVYRELRTEQSTAESPLE